jgi:RNA polymerase sigma-70 factor (ECF subfamily)
MNETELDQLVERVQNGDRDAFGEVVFAIRKELRIFLSAHACSIDMVEEVLQHTLVVSYENIAKYERRGTFLSWTKGIARNLMLKELKARSRYVAPGEDELDRIVLDASMQSVQALDREEAYVEHLRNCLTKLPEESRQLIQQRYFNRLSIRELAEQNHRTETWVAVALFRVRDLLRDCIPTFTPPHFVY